MNDDVIPVHMLCKFEKCVYNEDVANSPFIHR